jgi:carboxylate-amine ligase
LVTIFTIGVEEEFHLVDPQTREIAPVSDRVLSHTDDDHLEPELQQSQLEIGSAVCESLDEVRRDVVRLRREAAAAAEKSGKRIAATGSHPFSHWRRTEVFDKEAYLRLEEDYQQLTREQVVCGCHVHVGFDDKEDAIQVMNAVRPWLPAILALSANSPFWMGEATGYHSFRNRMWQRWPTAGVPGTFRDRAEYDELVDALLKTGSIDNPARIYWDIRPSKRFDTLEFRVADVCMNVDDAVLVASLFRALSQTFHERIGAGESPTPVRDELIHSAMWRAARYGDTGDLIDVMAQQAVPAHELISSLLQFVRPALESRGEWQEIQRLVGQIRSRGTGASRQLAEFERTGRMEAVVDLILAETARV